MSIYSTPLRSKSSLYKRLQDRKFRRAFVSSRIAQTTATQIRVMRQKQELSQKDLARELGTSQNAVYRLENPKSTKPNISTLERIADFFGVGLVVRFAPFSEIVDWSFNLDQRSLVVPSFEDDPGFIERKKPGASATAATLTERVGWIGDWISTVTPTIGLAGPSGPTTTVEKVKFIDNNQSWRSGVVLTECIRQERQQLGAMR